jgi:hypothetical protein
LIFTGRRTKEKAAFSNFTKSFTLAGNYHGRKKFCQGHGKLKAGMVFERWGGNSANEEGER